MIRKMKALLADETGATMVEYALLISLVSIAAIGLLSSIGGKVLSMFQAVVDKM
jgi:Flp pilus assembly pilin Flp